MSIPELSPTVWRISALVFAIGITGFVWHFGIFATIIGTIIAAWETGKLMIAKLILYGSGTVDNPGTFDYEDEEYAASAGQKAGGDEAMAASTGANNAAIVVKTQGAEE